MNIDLTINTPEEATRAFQRLQKESGLDDMSGFIFSVLLGFVTKRLGFTRSSEWVCEVLAAMRVQSGTVNGEIIDPPGL